ncbi:MAG TPA: membrane protein insertase YidC, partial [Pyrinomonadaceae bacterium]
MQQRRLLLALLLSSVILFSWTYFFPAPTPPANQQAGTTPSPTPAATVDASQSPAPATPAAPVVTTINEAPQRTITIRTELYDAKFDTRGAEPISWVIKKNKNSGSEIYSVAGHKSEKKPLELISPEGLKRQPRLVPLQLHTGDAALDTLLASSTYRVEGADVSNGDVELNLAENETKQLTFVLEDSNGLQVRKTISFNAAQYQTEFSVQVKRGGAIVPQVKATIGPSIGDQGISQHTFYSVAPEAVAYVGGVLER